MKPSVFVHHAPRSVDEAIALLAEVGADAKVLAGGQSLIPILNMRLSAPGHLVDINRIVGLDTVEVRPDVVRIGALVRHAQLERHVGAFAHLPLLRQALVNVAHPVIRNRGTTVGSLAHADPSGEMPAVLALTGGYVDLASSRGSRSVPARDFFRGPMESCLEEDEMATGASFGLFPPGTGTAFAESTRRHGDYALAGVAAAVTVVGGLITTARVSFVSVTPTPNVLDLGELLAGIAPEDADWAVAAGLAREHVDPDSDIHASAGYRRMLVGVLTARVLAEAAAKAVTSSRTTVGSGAMVGSGATDPPMTPADQMPPPARPRWESEPMSAMTLTGAEPLVEIVMRVNGVMHTAMAPARRLLSDFLRHELRLTGTHVGCEHGVCGSCTVLVDGAPMRSCLMFAVTAQDHEITTVEGLAPVDGKGASTMSPVQQAFIESHGLQCGFCTPGFLTTITAYLQENPQPTTTEAREAISGNLCRCTGYQNIVKSVLRAAEITNERGAGA